jgi:hypothetical protein
VCGELHLTGLGGDYCLGVPGEPLLRHPAKSFPFSLPRNPKVRKPVSLYIRKPGIREIKYLNPDGAAELIPSTTMSFDKPFAHSLPSKHLLDISSVPHAMLVYMNAFVMVDLMIVYLAFFLACLFMRREAILFPMVSLPPGTAPGM